MLTSALRLYFLHCSAILAIAFSMYFPGLDLFLSILYWILLWQEAIHIRYKFDSFKQVSIGLLWQLPAIFLILAIKLGWDIMPDISYYFIFMLELWLTPVLPLISLIPAWVWNGKPLYYYLLIIMVPVLITFFIMPVLRKESAQVKPEKMNPLA